MRAFLFVIIAGCGAHATETVGGRNSNPPLALLTPSSGQWVSGRTQASDGARDYQLYVPAGVSIAQPLVVMLHGCEQTAQSFAGGTRMNALADAHGFLVLYPVQDLSVNADGCWNWFAPDNQGRRGEPAIVAAMVQAIAQRYSVDTTRVYIAGMSAGAALAVTAAVCYPEIFAAAGVHSGLEYAAATNGSAASWAQQFGGPDPAQQGQAAFACAARAGATVPAIVFHGDADSEVSPLNGAQASAQLTAFNQLADSGSQTSVELHTVAGLGHAWSGGDPSYAYASATGPDASTAMWNFFAQHHR